MNIMAIIEQMERGQYTLNIPTSLALESLTGIHPDRVWKTPPHLNHDQIWLNLKTLVRNIIGSFPKEVVAYLQPNLLAELIQDEWNQFKEVVRDKTNLEPILYVSNYSDMERRYNRNHALVRRDNTEKQKELSERTSKAIKIAMKQWDEHDIKVFSNDIAGQKGASVFIMTHIPYDLTFHQTFGELDLLESHTGMIKNRSLWYTKFLGGKELSMIPFTLYFLRIFGDKETFMPMDMKLRKDIVELAKKYQWNALTTDSRVRMCFEYLQNPYHKAILKEIMSTR